MSLKTYYLNRFCNNSLHLIVLKEALNIKLVAFRCIKDPEDFELKFENVLLKKVPEYSFELKLNMPPTPFRDWISLKKLELTETLRVLDVTLINPPPS
jgi:hypothetical protein